MHDDADFLMMMESISGEYLDESQDKLENVEQCLADCRTFRI